MATVSITAGWQTVIDVKRSISVSTAQKLRFASMVNKRIREAWLSADPSQLYSTSTVSVVSGTSSYALPSDFDTSKDEGTGLFFVDTNSKQTDNKLILTGFGSASAGYYIDSTNIILTPEPASTQTYTLRYIADLAVFSDLTDTFVVDDTYLELVRAGLLHQYEIFDRNPAGEAEAEQRFTFLLEEFIDNVAKTPNIFIDTTPNTF